MILALFLPIIEASTRSIIPLLPNLERITRQQGFSVDEILFQVFDISFLGIGLIFLTQSLNIGMISLFEIGKTITFPQVLTLSFWSSLGIIIVVFGVWLLQGKSWDVVIPPES